MSQTQESPEQSDMSAQDSKPVVNEADLKTTAAMNNSETTELPLRPKTNTTASTETRDSAQPTQQPVAGEGDENGGDQEDQDGHDYGEVTNVPPAEMKKKKKKKRSKPASKRGPTKPTGFEDYFADPPLTPEEHAEEQEIYHPGLPFVDRITTAIARFERTRKLAPERSDVLYKYLIYGGLARTNNVGQGGLDTEGMDKTQAALALSQVWISEDKRDLGTETSVYAVDFLGCVKGFLSRRVKNCLGLDTEDEVNMICTTLERFLDYLLQHDVCPEYHEDVLAARALCRKAAPELWDMYEATRRLPGEFNIACSSIFDGSYSRDYDGETWWGDPNTDGPVFVGLKPEEAQQIVKFGVAGAAAEEIYAAFLSGVQGTSPKMLEVVDTHERTGFEITRLEPPTRECERIYTTYSQHFRPVGRVYAKPWKNPDAAPEDLTPSEQQEHALLSTSSISSSDHLQDGGIEYVFFIEAILQSCLRVGTKIEATVRTLGCGIMFFDEVLNVYPTFDEFLVNELMVGWKSPKPVKGALDYVAGDYSDGGGEDGSDGDGD
ncbi:uncharacterized protein Z520_01987 [Fonsecaea multimorphosa CBS 102226]|uniref:Argonaute complex, subunit Arb1 n=1 Tax=Fonsecaea multimorphosa CBS 102226 TaxID=1442371 RepID=A0A0D2KYD9_9EURO|nr:uncharacterized protein Z520_01987 [Fonsecaea multimorphosa CBS 102226]KIY01849.1 hypothetical protein Z520_01987 [Fonsecaea multimorphosa CBS 102226]OAL29534.1 hypothetical protein AYO22_01948 [Fonsecaea multimorphosa]